MRKLLYVLILGIALTISCTEKREGTAFTHEQRTAMDSVVKANHSIDSLRRLLQKFTTDSNQLGRISCMLELGRQYRNSSLFEEANQIHYEGLQLAARLKDTISIIQMLNNIGTNYRRMGLLDLASEFHYSALDCSMAFSDTSSTYAKKNRVVSLNGLGNVYLTIGNQQLADSIFREALAGESQLGSALGQAINYANLGSIFEDEGQLDSARAYYTRSFELNRESNSRLGMALCHTHFGRLYEKEGRTDMAIIEYETAYRLLENSDDEWHWLSPCIALGQVYFNVGDRQKAVSYLNKALSIAERIKSPEHLAEIHNLYYKIYNSSGDMSQALHNYVKANEYEDSVVNLKKVNEMQNLRLRIEHNRQKEQMRLAEESYNMEHKAKNTAYISLLVFLLLASLLILLLWYALRMRIRNQRIMRQMQTTRENFFTNVTHEFRTPLTVILGEGRRMLEEPDMSREDQLTASQMIVRQGNNLMDLINQLLDISKVKSSVGDADWHRGNIVGYVTMVVELFYDYASQKRVELIYAPKEQELVMDFVPDYMTRILNNLISNALKFTPEYGRVYITTEKDDTEMKLTVADTGVGIESKDLPYIFEAFYQADDGTQNIGTGVGLSLVKQIVMEMGGKVSVHSAPGKGTVFTITLPLRHGERDYAPLATLTTRPSIMLPNPDDKEPTLTDDESNETATRILIVEDNTDVAYFIGQQLHTKYKIAYARNGEEGMKKALEIMPDLIITDVMMPGFDGYELCRRIRLTEATNHIPIIIITAKATQEDRVKGLQAGADAYLRKPFNSEELNVRVEMLLEQRRTLRERYSLALHSGNEQDMEMSRNDSDFVNRFVNVVYAQMAQGSVSVEAVASALCLSSSQLRRKMMATTGESPMGYINLVRMNKAKQMLASRLDLSIGDIAQKCGFEDNAHFTRIFKQKFNMTPSQYRKMPK